MNLSLDLLYHTTDPGRDSDCRLQVPVDLFMIVGVFPDTYNNKIFQFIEIFSFSMGEG